MRTTWYEKTISWPKPLPERRLVERYMKEVRRFIDFDGTIARQPGAVPFETICGVPLAEYLSQEPYIIQTWSSGDWFERFFDANPHLAKPVLVIHPQACDIEGEELYGKDFTGFAIEKKLIIDDWDSHMLFAPGCTIIKPR